MARHTTMPPRIQKTPHGDATLTSRWQRDRYYLMASGPIAALRWLFSTTNDGGFEKNGANFRHTFNPAGTPITVLRELQRVCAVWQARWNEKYELTLATAPSPLVTPVGATVISTLGQLFDHLHADRSTKIAKSTTSRDLYRLKVWRDELGNGFPLCDLTPERISSALASIGKKTSSVTANVALGVLKTYLNWAGNMGYVPNQSHRTVRKLKEPPGNKRQRAWWQPDDIALALKVAEADTNPVTAKLLIACGCYLGLRVEEIIMLRWQDLSLDAVDPKTNKPKPVCHITPNGGWQPKDGEARDIPICAPLLAILKLHQQLEGYLLNRQPGKTGRPRNGKGWIYRYDPKALWRRLMQAVVAAGGKKIDMYGMRHSFASNLLIANVSDVKVSRWLGHADTRMVHRHYGHLLSYDGDINALDTPPVEPKAQTAAESPQEPKDTHNAPAVSPEPKS